MPDEQTRLHVPVPFANHLAAVAGGAMVLWLAVEFAFRRGLAPHLTDILGTSVGAGAISSLFGFAVAAAGVAWWGTQAGVTPTNWEYSQWRRQIAAGAVGVLGIYAVRAAAVIGLIFGLGFELPAGTDPLGLGNAPAWALGTFFLVNGIIGPVVEELAWRGVIQTALTEAYGTSLAVIVTAGAFVLKHLIVDLSISPFRTTALVILAVSLGILRARYGTTSSTVAHVLMNSLETTLAILALT